MNSHAFQKLKTKRVYSIEGNIGAGKTTILKIIEKSIDDVYFVEEPVSQWQNVGGFNLLEKFYEDPDRWGFSFEFYVMLTKLKALAKAAESEKPVIILERSFFSNKIFMDTSAKLGKLNDLEYHMLNNIYEFFMSNVYPMLSGIIYLNTPVDVCISRIAKRNRGEESAVDKSYLTMLKEKFDQLANDSTIPTLILDGNFDLQRDTLKISLDMRNFVHPEIEIKY